MRSLVRSAALAFGLFASASVVVHAETWPSKSVRVIVPYAAGGAADVIGRIFADQLSRRLGQTFFVENRSGGGGVVGTEMVARAAPDGYTLMVSGFPSHIAAPGMNPNAKYDAIKDFTHIAYFGGPPNVFVVHPKFGVNTFAQFMKKIEGNPNGVNYVSPGVGTGGNMVAEFFKLKSGVKLTHVAYRGGGEAVKDLLGGQVQVGSMTLSTTISHIRAGSLIPLAVSSEERVADMPNVPTLKELGYPDIVATTWFSLSGPAGLPRAVVDKINHTVVESLKDPQVRKRLDLEEVQVRPMSPEQFTAFMQSERTKWAPVLAAIAKK